MAKETEADGGRRAMIKQAEGREQAAILKQRDNAGIDLHQQIIHRQCPLLKQLEVTQNALEDNANIILTKRYHSAAFPREASSKRKDAGEEVISTAHHSDDQSTATQ